jgi:plastocyanin
MPVAVLLAIACGGDSDPVNQNPNNNPPPPANTSTDINIDPGASTRTTNAFNPNPKVVSLGGNPSVTIRWINGDITGGDYQQGTPTQHSIVAENAADFAPSPTLNGNSTYSITLSAAGSYDYHCGIHPGMVGTITVNP